MEEHSLFAVHHFIVQNYFLIQDFRLETSFSMALQEDCFWTSYEWSISGVRYIDIVTDMWRNNHDFVGGFPGGSRVWLSSILN